MTTQEEGKAGRGAFVKEYEAKISHTQSWVLGENCFTCGKAKYEVANNSEQIAVCPICGKGIHRDTYEEYVKGTLDGAYYEQEKEEQATEYARVEMKKAVATIIRLRGEIKTHRATASKAKKKHRAYFKELKAIRAREKKEEK